MAKGNTSAKAFLSKDLQSQHAYVQRLQKESFDFSIVVARAFVNGMRDIGYKSTATALNELIDNAVQAEAQNVHVIFGYSGGSDAKPDKIAVIDDGHGMEPVMVRAAVLWGGTHREGDTSGFGRYGYGLPSSCVSQGEKFTVYSRIDRGAFYAVDIDLNEIAGGRYTDSDGRIRVPLADESAPPEWVKKYIDENWGREGLVHGTIVVIERIDRLTWKTTKHLRRNLLEQFGIYYRNYLREFKLFVDGEQVDRLDPLFITPGCRFYDLDEDRAEALDPMHIDVKDSEGRNVVGTVKVRFSYMPPSFQVDKTGKKKNNARLGVMKQHNGIVVLRHGRQIDVVTSECPWPINWNIYDRNWKVEIDFPPTLDREFSITTSKQQVRMSERMWDILMQEGVYKAIRNLRRRFTEEKAKADDSVQQPNGRRVSEEVMEEIAKFKSRRTASRSAEKEEEARRNLDEEVRRRAKKSGLSEEEVRPKVEAESEKQLWKVEFPSHRYGVFFYAEQRGGQMVIHINTAHRFYTDVYASKESTRRLQAALELLLFIIGECELEATDERALFYESERNEWSKQLSLALEKLNEHNNIEDHNASLEPEENVRSEPEPDASAA